MDVNEGREFMEKETITTRAMRATEEDLRLFKACFEDNNDAKDLNHLRWQYLENPAKQILVDFAVAGSASGPYLAAMGLRKVKRVLKMPLSTRCVPETVTFPESTRVICN